MSFALSMHRQAAGMLRGVYPERTAEILRFAQDDSERAQHDITQAQRLARNRCPPRRVLPACTLLFILGWCLTAFKQRIGTQVSVSNSESGLKNLPRMMLIRFVIVRRIIRSDTIQDQWA